MSADPQRPPEHRGMQTHLPLDVDLVASIGACVGVISTSEIDHLDGLLPMFQPASEPESPGVAGAEGTRIALERLRPIAASVRWTAWERSAFARAAIGINVLEYFASAYLVLLWGPSLRGKVVAIRTDSTAAMAWLAKGRYTGVSDAGQDLVRILSLYCVQERITILPSKIKGASNTLADNLSRCIYLQDLDAVDPSPPDVVAEAPPLGVDEDADVDEPTWCRSLSRPQICRRLLTRLLLPRSPLRPQQVLQLVSRLRGRPGRTSAPG